MVTTPKLHIEANNVELTTYQQRLIARRMGPIATFHTDSPLTDVSVVIRRTITELEGEMFFVSVKATTTTDSFMAVAAKPYLSRALSGAREMIQKAMSRGESVRSRQIGHVVTDYVNAYTLTL